MSSFKLRICWSQDLKFHKRSFKFISCKNSEGNNYEYLQQITNTGLKTVAVWQRVSYFEKVLEISVHALDMVILFVARKLFPKMPKKNREKVIWWLLKNRRLHNIYLKLSFRSSAKLRHNTCPKNCRNLGVPWRGTSVTVLRVAVWQRLQ